MLPSRTNTAWTRTRRRFRTTGPEKTDSRPFPALRSAVPGSPPAGRSEGSPRGEGEPGRAGSRTTGPPGFLLSGRFPSLPADLFLRRPGPAGRGVPGAARGGRAEPVLRVARVRLRRGPRRAVPALESVRVPGDAFRRRPPVGDVLSDELALRRPAARPRDQPGDHPQPLPFRPLHVSVGATVRPEAGRRDHRRRARTSSARRSSCGSSRGIGASWRPCRGFPA